MSRSWREAAECCAVGREVDTARRCGVIFETATGRLVKQFDAMSAGAEKIDWTSTPCRQRSGSITAKSARMESYITHLLRFLTR